MSDNVFGRILTRNRLIGLAVAAVIYLLDQWIKRQVDGPWGLKRIGDKIELLPFFDLNRVHNFGVSMGMFQATSMEMRWGLVALTAFIAFAVFIWMLREKAFGEILALSLVLGGALGNIHDRYVYGYVLDYADFHIGDFRPFFIFNLADAAITIGVLIILARSLLVREKDEETTNDEAGSGLAENG